MKKAYKNIYILTPNGAETGGVEALFQLAHAINLLKGNASSVFHPNAKDTIQETYKNYKIKRSKTIADSEENLLIVPEIWTEYLDSYKKINKAIWWLSIDNNFGTFADFSNSSIGHFSQSHYAYNYLKEKGCNSVFNLFDYLKDDFFGHISYDTPKQDIVCFNPKKGLEFTNKIMALLPDVKFVPIENMSSNEVIKLLKSSKVYIDFGHHPGKDRIPREAVLFYNCILTSNLGAAQNDIDIPISKNYKFEEYQLPEIASKIRECLSNHNILKHDFDSYRKQIWNQKEEFYNQIRQLFL